MSTLLKTIVVASLGATSLVMTSFAVAAPKATPAIKAVPAQPTYRGATKATPAVRAVPPQPTASTTRRR